MAKRMTQIGPVGLDELPADQVWDVIGVPNDKPSRSARWALFHEFYATGVLSPVPEGAERLDTVWPHLDLKYSSMGRSYGSAAIMAIRVQSWWTFTAPLVARYWLMRNPFRPDWSMSTVRVPEGVVLPRCQNPRWS